MEEQEIYRVTVVFHDAAGPAAKLVLPPLEAPELLANVVNGAYMFIQQYRPAARHVEELSSFDLRRALLGLLSELLYEQKQGNEATSSRMLTERWSLVMEVATDLEAGWEIIRADQPAETSTEDALDFDDLDDFLITGSMLLIAP